MAIRRHRTRSVDRLAWWTAWAALTELVVLRIVTRTLIHIPGLAAIEGPIRAVSEVGRLAYYVTAVLLLCLLILLVGEMRRLGSMSSMLIGAGIATIMLLSVAGRLGFVDAADVGGLGLAGFVIIGAGSAYAGWRALPVLLLVVATYASGSATTLQGWGGGLSQGSFVGLMSVSEISAVGGCLLLPIVLGKPISRKVLILGLGAAALVTTMLSVASPTSTIIILWSFGLPATLPAGIYGLAVGSLVAVAATAVRDGQRGLAAGLLLSVAGGVGPSSTYQTALLTTGLGLVALNIASSYRGLPETSPQSSKQAAPSGWRSASTTSATSTRSWQSVPRTRSGREMLRNDHNYSRTT